MATHAPEINPQTGQAQGPVPDTGVGENGIERSVASTREQLDQATFAAARSEELAMSLEKAVAYALGREK